MKIDSTPENSAKLAALIEALQTGKIDGTQMRQPVSVEELRQALGVSRSTLYRWRGKSHNRQRVSEHRRFCRVAESIPVDNNFEAIASKVLRVPVSRLQQYFDDKITLADLFKPVTKETPVQEVVRMYQGLTNRDKYVVLAQLLEAQARSLPFNNNMLIMQKLNNASVVSHQGSGNMPDEISGFGAMCLRDFINERLRQVGGFEALASNLRVFVSEQNLQIIQLFLEGSVDVDLSEMGNFLGAIAYGMQLLGFTHVTPEVLSEVAARSRESHLSC